MQHCNKLLQWWVTAEWGGGKRGLCTNWSSSNWKQVPAGSATAEGELCCRQLWQLLGNRWAIELSGSLNQSNLYAKLLMHALQTDKYVYIFMAYTYINTYTYIYLIRLWIFNWFYVTWQLCLLHLALTIFWVFVINTFQQNNNLYYAFIIFAFCLISIHFI